MGNGESGNEGLHVDRVCLALVLRFVRMHVSPEHKGM